MANNKKQVVAAKPNNGNKSKKGMWIAIAAAAVLVVAGIAAYLVLNFSPIGEQRKMESYLKERYGKEFVVGKPERKGAGLAVEGRLEASAHSADDKSLTFMVFSSSAGMSDTYLGELWTMQENSLDKPLLTSIIGGDLMDLKIEVLPSYQKEKSINTAKIDLEDAIKLYPGALAYYLHVKQKGDFSTSDHTGYISKAYQLIQYIRSKGFSDISLSYTVDTGKTTYSCGLSDTDIQLIHDENSNVLMNCFRKAN